MVRGWFHSLRRWTDRILWWSAGTIPAVAEKLPQQERFKYLSIGAVVLTSNLFACLALGYLSRVITESFGIALLSAFLWGAMLIALDRNILATMITKERAGYTAKLLQIAPRVLLTALLGLMIAYPFELVLFANEIDRKTQNAAAIGDIDEQNAALEADTKSLRDQLQSAAADVNEKFNSYLNEVRGLNGHIGIGPAAMIKRQVYEQAESELKQQQTQLEAQIRANSVRVAELQSRKDQLLRSRSDRPTSFIARAEALAVLRRENSAVRRIHYLLWGFFILIGITPILLKLLAPTDLYEYVVDHEHDHLAIQQMRQLDERTEKTAEMMQRAFAAALDESVLNPADKGAAHNVSR